jgi:hypothetical protein
MTDHEITQALSFLKPDDRKLLERIIDLLILGKKVELVEKDTNTY